MIKCDTCPRCKDIYPGRVDVNGYPFRICGMSGNIVYVIPRKEKRYNGNGYVYFGVSGCGLYKTVKDALNAMTEPERKRWLNEQSRKTKNEKD